jgi:vacuolar iron transporter family protein
LIAIKSPLGVAAQSLTAAHSNAERSKMARAVLHTESHLIKRIGWLRAAVLGANDGIVSTASLIVGVAASGAGQGPILVAGVAGLVAGAMSMAAGEYVSVSSQSDTENADLAREALELKTDIEFERKELADIYIGRGVEPDLARKVAEQMMAKDALGAHAREELGISDITTARPVQAAITSALTFSAGAILPLLVVLIAPLNLITAAVALAAIAFLALLGAIGARAGGANPVKPVIRVVFWGAIALAVTAGVGALFGPVG